MKALLWIRSKRWDDIDSDKLYKEGVDNFGKSCYYLDPKCFACYIPVTFDGKILSFHSNDGMKEFKGELLCNSGDARNIKNGYLTSKKR